MEGLKKKMSYEEMAEHMRKNSLKAVNRVNVGLYAKGLGFRVYKPMIHGQVCHFYINEYLQIDGDKTK